jgi:hypothetical protein
MFRSSVQLFTFLIDFELTYRLIDVLILISSHGETSLVITPKYWLNIQLVKKLPMAGAEIFILLILTTGSKSENYVFPHYYVDDGNLLGSTLRRVLDAQKPADSYTGMICLPADALTF